MSTTSEASILSRVIAEEDQPLSPEAARSILNQNLLSLRDPG